MKRIIILTLPLVIISLCACGEVNFVNEEFYNIASEEQEETLCDKILKSIESEYNKDSLKDEYITTGGMVELAGKYAEKWDSVSTEYYNKIIECSGDKKDIIKNKLDELRKAYSQYEKNNLDMKSEIYNIKYQGGSMGHIAYASDYYELRKSFALEIIGIYENMILD